VLNLHDISLILSPAKGDCFQALNSTEVDVWAETRCLGISFSSRATEVWHQVKFPPQLYECQSRVNAAISV